ncbi:MAG: DNA polymerase III subunit gamma and tau [bacterium]
MALYRKYRSATFADVIGQEHVTVPLSAALSAGRINHAYLFSGPRGCGKTSSARILARSLNCVQGPTPTPCGVCDSCRELAPNGPGSIDVIEIDAASHGGVDDARDLRERAFYAPVRDRYKVYIIDEAHMVTTQGFNALLKLIEEPPDFLVFVFATTEPDKVLQTIRSRTHHYPFRLVPPGTMRAHLERICAAEGAVVEPTVLPLVVRAGGGSVRDSLSLLDQLLAGSGPEGITYRRAVGLLGVTDGALIDAMVDALAAGDAATVYGTVERVVEAGHDPRRFAADLLDRLRDLLVLHAVPEAAEKGLLDGPEDTLARMADQASRLGGASAARYAEIVHTALVDMRGTTAPRLILELVCARMLLPDASADSAALLQRLERLERRLGAAQPPATPLEPTSARPAPAGDSLAAPASATPPTEAPSSAVAAAEAEPRKRRTPATKSTATPASTPVVAGPDSASPPAAASSTAGSAARATDSPSASVGSPASPTFPAAEPAPEARFAAADERLAASPVGEVDIAALRTIWPQVLDEVKERSRTTRALLESVQLTDLRGTRLALVQPALPLARMLGEPRNTEVIASVLTHLLGGTWSVLVSAEATLATLTTAADVSLGPARESGLPASADPEPSGASSLFAGSAPSASTPSASQEPVETPAPSARPDDAAAVARGGPHPAGTDGEWPAVTPTGAPVEPSTVEAARSRPEPPAAASARPEDYPDEDDSVAAQRHDPEADALALLETGLGARRVER